jgi:RNA polymerase sigma-70 factor (ECF subfamily)
MNLALRDDVAALATLARCLCGNSADADDLVQDTLERALRAEQRYVERGSLRAWLGTILRNRYRDRCRERNRRPHDSVAIDKVASPEPEEPAHWEHVTETQVGAALAQLEPGFRAVYELHAAGCSYKQIARELDISINTVGTRLFRARTKLREILLASSSSDGDRRDAAGRSGPSAG